MKKIAVIRSTYLPISETFIYEELIKLEQYKPYVFTKKQINLDHFPFNRVIVEPNNRRLISHFKKMNIDLIHARFGTTAVDLIDVKRKSRLPMITSFHGHDHPNNQSAGSNYRKQLWLLFRVGDLFTVTNKKMRQALIRYGCPANKVVVHHSGIDLEKIPFTERSIDGKNDPIRILFVGRLVEKKGAEYLIQAFHKIRKKYPNTRLTIVGEGELRPRLQTMIEKLHLHEQIDMVGKRSHKEVLDFMKNAHLFCLPSITAKSGNQEGIPNVLKEAMASGLPVISTFHAGIPELITNGKNGFLVKEKDSLGLAKKMMEVLESPEKWSAISRKARKKVEQDFNVRKQIRHLEGLYQKVIGKAQKVKK